MYTMYDILVAMGWVLLMIAILDPFDGDLFDVKA